MILDRGVCRIYRKRSTTPKGGKPTSSLEMIHESYYGELSFETSPARPTEKREETQTATRVRILQNREINNQDLAELIPFDNTGGVGNNREAGGNGGAEGNDGGTGGTGGTDETGGSGGKPKYRIRRAWHGADNENGEQISDLTLEVEEK